MNAAWIDDTAEWLFERMLDEDAVQLRICDGCRWSGSAHGSPDSGCGDFEQGSCENYGLVRDLYIACRDAAELIGNAV